jgi:hypothetical protein
MIADRIRHDVAAGGTLRYGDFNSLLRANRALYDCLNPMMRKEAAMHIYRASLALTHVMKHDNLAGLETLLEHSANVETNLDFNIPEFDECRDIYEDPGPSPRATARRCLSGQCFHGASLIGTRR